MRFLRHFLAPFHFEHPDPALPPVGDPAPEPTPERRHRCEFCECTLTTRGEVLKLSDKARGFRDADEKLSAHAKDLARLTTELADTKTKLAQATAPAASRIPRVAIGR